MADINELLDRMRVIFRGNTGHDCILTNEEMVDAIENGGGRSMEDFLSMVRAADMAKRALARIASKGVG